MPTVPGLVFGTIHRTVAVAEPLLGHVPIVAPTQTSSPTVAQEVPAVLAKDTIKRIPLDLMELLAEQMPAPEEQVVQVVPGESLELRVASARMEIIATVQMVHRADPAGAI